MNDDVSKLNVAIACDWLTGIGGAERVVLELHKIFPNAPIYTSQYDPKKIDWFKDADVRTGWLNYFPSSLKKFLPLFRAIYFRQLKLNDYDLVISSSGAEAKAVKARKGAVHISYCHSPTHYYWVRYEEYLKNPGFGKFNWLARIGLKILVKPLKRLDYRAAQNPDYLIANSTFTQKNIKEYYGRDSEIIFPPVDIERFRLTDKAPRNGFVTVGRQTPYMRKDLAVAACTQLGLPLKVIGRGPEHEKLLQIAGPTIEFLTNVSDQDLPKYLHGSRAFILPGIEDFGISGIESLASGTPIIAVADGGPPDYVSQRVNGLLFKEQEIKSLVDALGRFEGLSFNQDEIEKTATRFSPENFDRNLLSYIKSAVA